MYILLIAKGTRIEKYRDHFDTIEGFKSFILNGSDIDAPEDIFAIKSTLGAYDVEIDPSQPSEFKFYIFNTEYVRVEPDMMDLSDIIDAEGVLIHNILYNIETATPPNIITKVTNLATSIKNSEQNINHSFTVHGQSYNIIDGFDHVDAKLSNELADDYVATLSRAFADDGTISSALRLAYENGRQSVDSIDDLDSMTCEDITVTLETTSDPNYSDQLDYSVITTTIDVKNPSHRSLAGYNSGVEDRKITIANPYYETILKLQSEINILRNDILQLNQNIEDLTALNLQLNAQLKDWHQDVSVGLDTYGYNDHIDTEPIPGDVTRLTNQIANALRTL